jgi:hypothetical protein
MAGELDYNTFDRQETILYCSPLASFINRWGWQRSADTGPLRLIFGVFTNGSTGWVQWMGPLDGFSEWVLRFL